MNGLNRNSTKVWDPAIRIFHWSLVVLCLAAFLSAEGSETVHAYVGYGIVLLLLFRVIWGFIGTRHARFTDFVYGPAEISAYLKGFFNGRSKYYHGHNPAGGVMVFLLLISLLITSYTGLKAYGEEGHGPLGADNGFSITASAYADDHGKNKGHNSKEEVYEEVHEFFAGFTLFLIIVHITGVFVTTFFHKEHLIRGMITGRKPLQR